MSCGEEGNKVCYLFLSLSLIAAKRFFIALVLLNL